MCLIDSKAVPPLSVLEKPTMALIRMIQRLILRRSLALHVDVLHDFHSAQTTT